MLDAARFVRSLWSPHDGRISCAVGGIKIPDTFSAPVGSAQSEEREAQANRIVGEDAQGEASGEIVEANARHQSDANGMRQSRGSLPAQPAKLQPFKPAQPVKIVMQKSIVSDNPLRH